MVRSGAKCRVSNHGGKLSGRPSFERPRKYAVPQNDGGMWIDNAI